MTRKTNDATNKVPPKAAKAKNDNMLIGITVNKEDDFSGWYQQIARTYSSNFERSQSEHKQKPEYDCSWT